MPELKFRSAEDHQPDVIYRVVATQPDSVVNPHQVMFDVVDGETHNNLTPQDALLLAAELIRAASKALA